MGDEEQKKEGPPDIVELISSIKNKIGDRIKSTKDSKVIGNVQERLAVGSCSCEGDKRKDVVDIKAYCRECSHVFIRKTVTKPYKVAAILAILSYGASQIIEYVITDNRYPLKLEYALVESCINAYERPLQIRDYHGKKETCLCAIEDAMNEISYVRYSINEDAFLSSMEEKAKVCPG